MHWTWASVIFMLLYLTMWLFHNCSVFLGFGAPTAQLAGRQITDVSGLDWDHRVTWDRMKCRDKGRDSRLPSGGQPGSGPSPLTTAPAASWGGKAGSPWCTRRPGCQSSSSPRSLCTSAAQAAPGPARTRVWDMPELPPLLRTHHRQGKQPPNPTLHPPSSIWEAMAYPPEGEDVNRSSAGSI